MGEKTHKSFYKWLGPVYFVHIGGSRPRSLLLRYNIILSWLILIEVQSHQIVEGGDGGVASKLISDGGSKKWVFPPPNPWDFLPAGNLPSRCVSALWNFGDISLSRNNPLNQVRSTILDLHLFISIFFTHFIINVMHVIARYSTSYCSIFRYNVYYNTPLFTIEVFNWAKLEV
jgi:hypothetical protein